MKAALLRQLKSPLVLEQLPDPSPGPGEAVVELHAAAINRRDYWITQGMYPGIRLPVVLGSDGAGVVTRCGPDVDPTWLGREVVINPGFDWGDEPTHQSDRFTILGMPRDGTFAEAVAVPASQLHSKPEHLDWPLAAALPLGGVTAYRALFTQGRIRAGERVLVTGIGGGVATFALQFALAAGADVWVTSSSQAKRDGAVERGAAGAFDYRQTDWLRTAQETAGAFDLIIDSAGGKGYGSLVELAAPGGRIVNYGATAGPPETVDLFKVFWKQLRLQGTTMGSPDDFAAMLEFTCRHRIEPIVDTVHPLDDINEALEAMRKSRQFGKLVLA